MKNTCLSAALALGFALLVLLAFLSIPKQGGERDEEHYRSEPEEYSSVPEPSSAALLLVGIPFLARRKR